MAQTQALLVIDMQNDFCLPSSPLCVAGAQDCLPLVKEAVELARQKQVPVVWVIREHEPTGVDVEYTRAHLFNAAEGKGSTVPGTSGAALVEGLECKPGDITIIKKRFSGFFHTHLDLVLRRLGVRSVILSGVQTPNCIRATAVDALGLDYRCVVLSDASGAKSQVVHDYNLEDMRCMGIATQSVKEWASSLQ